MLVKIIAFLAIVQLAQSSSCTKGPSYWCQSVQTAKECGAYNHCLQSVWSKHETYTKNQVSNSQECSSCVKCLFGDVRHCPKLREFKTEISELFEKNISSESICHLINQCEKKSVIKPPVTRCDSQNVCSNLAMSVKCSSFPLCLEQWKQQSFQFKKSATKLAHVEDSKEKSCGFCIYIFTEIQKVIQQNQTEINVENYLKSGCNLIPNGDLSKQCNEQIDMYTPQIFNFLRDNCDPGVICHAIQMCDDKFLEPKKQIKKEIKLGSTELSTKMKSTGGMACEICSIVFQTAKFLVKNEVDEKKVIQFVDKNLCNRLGSFNETCSMYVEKEGESIIEILEDDIEPAVICGSIGLCINTQVKLQSKPFDLRQKSPETCSACKRAVDNAKDMIASHYRDIDVMNTMNKELCEKMGDLKYLCKSTMDAYSQSIIAIMGQKIESVQVCEMFGTCGIETIKKIEEVKPTEVTKVQKDDNNCVVCRFAMKLLDQFIAKNSTEIEIREGLDKVCRLTMPNKYKEQCVQLVDTYTDTVIYLLTKQVPSDYICEIIGVCKETTANKFVTAFLKQNSKDFIGHLPTGNEIAQKKPDCGLCEFTILYLTKYIKSNSTEDELITESHLLCNKLPGKVLKVRCNIFVDIYGKQIIEMITEDLDPKTTCQQIGACSKELKVETTTPQYDWRKNLAVEATTLPSVHLKKTINQINLIDLQPAKKIDSTIKHFEEKKESETIECTLCIYVAQLSDHFLKQNKTVDEIEQEFKLVCNYFPNQLNAQCNSFIEEYGPYVIQLIATDLDPETVCKNLKLCGNPSPPKPILSFANIKTSQKEYAYVMPENNVLDFDGVTIKNVKVKEFTYKPKLNNQN